MPPAKIMIIRHAEKPEKGGARAFDAWGEEDKNSLIARGWQRAGALVRFFNPLDGALTPGLARPDHIYAAAANKKINPSERSRQTVEPLALSLTLHVDDRFTETQEEKMAADALSRSGVVLISWSHEAICKITEAIAPGLAPEDWPDDRFDIVYVFDAQGDSWRFSQVPQQLLPGDRTDVIG
ncbi:MAG: histidine phosphatase family protein [Hyphomicrobiales bacterium]|nr:histidine phosphatase family protein [Hyphomicrobiales bacterium]